MAAAGYSPAPLLKKLGVKDGMSALLISVPPEVEALNKFSGWKKVTRATAASGASGPFDYIHIFAANRADFAAAIPLLKKALAPAGMIWASWPKKSSRVATDLSDMEVRTLGLKSGLVDIKVCAVDAIWSGLKFVIPVKDRKA